MALAIVRDNSADSVPTSDLVCIKEVAIRTISTDNIAGIIHYTYSLVIDLVIVPVIKMPSGNVFNELCVKITPLRS